MAIRLSTNDGLTHDYYQSTAICLYPWVIPFVIQEMWPPGLRCVPQESAAGHQDFSEVIDREVRRADGINSIACCYRFISTNVESMFWSPQACWCLAALAMFEHTAIARESSGWRRFGLNRWKPLQNTIRLRDERESWEVSDFFKVIHW